MSQTLPVLIAQDIVSFQHDAGLPEITASGAVAFALSASGAGDSAITAQGGAGFFLTTAGAASSGISANGGATFSLSAVGTATPEDDNQGAATFTLSVGGAASVGEITASGAVAFNLSASGSIESSITADGGITLNLSASGGSTSAISANGAVQLNLTQSGAASSGVDAAGGVAFSFGAHGSQGASSGLLCPDVSLQQRYAPQTTLEQALSAETSLTQRYSPIVSFHSSCHDGGPMAGAIDDQIYPDNDANITIEGLPTGLVVEWRIAATEDHDASAIGSLTGVCSEDNAGPDPVYRGVIEGEDITSELVPGHMDTPVFLHGWSGQDFHVVAQTTLVKSRAA